MLTQVDAVASGLCQCGCGGRTPIATRTDPRRGHVAGLPLRFVHGHNRRRRGITASDYTVDDNGCWLWRWRLNDAGYGRVTRDGVVILAHRAAYEQLIGPVPDGLELDHLCRTPHCINPAHLEPVSHAENVKRGLVGDLRETCRNGIHPWIPENQASNGPGKLCCRPCKQERERRRYARD